tara:strand:- start:692 stop:1171 length:480 start_codon:yes stop_codon:yes gene_type:complete
MLNSILIQFKYPDIEVQQVFFTFNKIFEPIIGLKENDKIGLIDDIISDDTSFKVFIKLSQIKWNLYLDKSSYTQSLSRWWHQQNREDIFKKLNIMFEVYINYIKYVKVQILYNKFIDLDPKIKDFNMKLVLGLNNLKLTYKSDKKIKDIIISIIKQIFI